MLKFLDSVPDYEASKMSHPILEFIKSRDRVIPHNPYKFTLNRINEAKLLPKEERYLSYLLILSFNLGTLIKSKTCLNHIAGKINLTTGERNTLKNIIGKAVGQNESLRLIFAKAESKSPNAKVQNIDAFLCSPDWFGLLESTTMEEKVEVLSHNYKHFFAFSVERLCEFIIDPCHMLIMAQYLKETNLERLSTRSLMQENC